MTGPLSTTTLTLPEGARLTPPGYCAGCGNPDRRDLHSRIGCSAPRRPLEKADLFVSALYRTLITLYPPTLPDWTYPEPDPVTAARIRAAVRHWADVCVPDPPRSA